MLLLLLVPGSSPLEIDCADPEAAGRALQAEGRWEDAAEQFSLALQKCGKDAGLFSSLGQALWQSGAPDKALENFRKAVELEPQNPFMVYNLGSLLHWEGEDLTAAEIALEKAVQLSDEQGGNEMLSRHAARARDRCREASSMRIKREKWELELGIDVVSEVRDTPSTPWQDKVAIEAGGELSREEFFKLVGPVKGTVLPVDEREADELTYNEFMTEYALKSKPVVIRGLARKITQDERLWDADTIAEKCGNHTIIPRVFDKTSTKWAGLEDEAPISVKDFIERFKSDPGSKSYLFDWGLPKSCTQLLSNFVVPKYFAGDYLQRFPADKRDPSTGVDQPPRLYADSWPSLFVGPAHSGGGLHIDSFGSNFWMAVLSGRKLWTFFDENQLPLLYQSHQDDTFGVDTRQPDYARYPLYAFTNSSVCIVGPGDGLFVPAGSPHQVTNLSPSIAISMNYIDASNIDTALASTKLEGLVDSESDLIHSKLLAVHAGDKSLSQDSDEAG